MDTVQARRWTRQEYHRMIEAGILTPNDRVEHLCPRDFVAPQSRLHARIAVTDLLP